MRDLTPDVAIKQNDTAPAITATAIVAATELPKDLTNATALFKLAKVSDGTPKTLAGTTTIPTPAQGALSYAWNAADTTVPGDYAGEFQVTYADLKVETFPPDRQILVRITPEAG